MRKRPTACVGLLNFPAGGRWLGVCVIISREGVCVCRNCGGMGSLMRADVGIRPYGVCADREHGRRDKPCLSGIRNECICRRQIPHGNRANCPLGNGLLRKPGRAMLVPTMRADVGIRPYGVCADREHGRRDKPCLSGIRNECICRRQIPHGNRANCPLGNGLLRKPGRAMLVPTMRADVGIRPYGVCADRERGRRDKPCLSGIRNECICRRQIPHGNRANCPLGNGLLRKPGRAMLVPTR